MVKVWVTVPTLDEVENVDALVHRIRAAVDDAHILIVDDASSDGTADKAEALGAELGGIEVLRRPRKMGLGSAYRAGHAIGIARGYDSGLQPPFEKFPMKMTSAREWIEQHART